jgi:gas vesicle protein
MGKFKGGLITGAIFGVAAGIFMSSKKGKALARELRSQSMAIQKRIMREMKKSKAMTESAYRDSIDTVLAYYETSKQIASKEVPALRRYLMSKWKDVQRELKSVKPKTG